MPVSSAALEAAQLIDRIERLARLGEAPGGINPAQWEALRYLGRANRFSRTPAALADYLASTRGTVSRTLASLEAKGYVARSPNPRDGRSVDFILTAQAREALGRDPLLGMAEDIDQALGRDAAVLRDSLKRTLGNAIARNNGRAFGACASCRHFRAHAHASSATPHHCGLLDLRLSDADSLAICVEQEPAVA
jgi:DNA-binding MarR family transcriptional regulator